MEATVETETAAAAVGTPIDTVLRPMARLLTGQRPEGAETVAGPTEETWGPPSDTWAAAATEEEEGTDEDGTEEGKEEECRLESPSTLGCCNDNGQVRYSVCSNAKTYSTTHKYVHRGIFA